GEIAAQPARRVRQGRGAHEAAGKAGLREGQRLACQGSESGGWRRSVMRIVFCNDDLTPRAVDPSYENESVAASDAGFDVDVVDFTAVRTGDADTCVRLVKVAGDVETAIYRGWMLTPSEYRVLYNALYRRNIRLINSP